MRAIEDGTNPLKIGIPSPLGNVMSVADVVAKQGTFSANITACCHDDLLRGFQKTPNYSKFWALASKPKSEATPEIGSRGEPPFSPFILSISPFLQFVLLGAMLTPC